MKQAFAMLIFAAWVCSACQTQRSADGMTEVFIPAGALQMGGFDNAAQPDEKPLHSVSMHAFWIDKYEATNGMYAQCMNDGDCVPPQALSSQTHEDYFTNPAYKEYPVVQVSWHDATSYCKWAGRRLPTEAEWERAARGDTKNTYPWGEESADQTRANFDDPNGDTNRIGSYAAGASPFGVMDMAGNVAEWVNDFYAANYYAASPASDPAGPEPRHGFFDRVVRGGSFADAKEHIRASSRVRELGSDLYVEDSSTAAYFGSFNNMIGFRCAMDSTP